MPVASTILIADDYPDALDVWEVYLRAEGFEVLTATDGQEALSRATEAHPDLVVMDLEMPGYSGFEVARMLRSRADTRAIPLIASTGHSHAPQLEEARRCGFDAVLVKPCDPDTLVGEIRRLLAARPSSGSAPADH
jgi:two-component system, cell cycle response regulator DivK